MGIIRKIIILVFFISTAVQAASEPLSVDQAFSFHVYTDTNKQLIAEWDIADGYYLYRKQMHFVAAKDSQVKLATIILPQGLPHHDAIRGDYQAYVGKIIVPILLSNPAKGLLKLNIMYQGCSSAGFCYAMVNKHLNIDLAKLKKNEDLSNRLTSARKTISEQDYVTQLLVGHPLIYIVLAFLGLGLLLAFTPCVLPMVPILSGIIVDHSRKNSTTTLKAFLLSLFYVLGMALTYMVLGIVVALLGSSVQTTMQKPWVLILFSSFFVVLALSLFGLYALQFPASWQRHLIKWDRHFKHGTYSGVFLMGCFSSLIVSPCVSAPLVGVLAYIGQTGDVVLGATALLALGLGMGIPLLLVGTSAGKLLPRSGPWMVSIQKIFGILMLGMAVWLISRLIPELITELLWAALLIISAMMLGAFQTAISAWDKILKGVGVAFFIYAIVILVNAGLKNPDPLRAWQLFYSQQSVQSALPVKLVKNMSELDEQLVLAKRESRPVMLDFYADWCASCKIIDKKVFENPEIQQGLKNLVVLRADVTKENEFDQQLSKRFSVIAPPTVLFFDREGGELTSQRFVGEFSAKQFIQRLQEMKFISE